LIQFIWLPRSLESSGEEPRIAASTIPEMKTLKRYIALTVAWAIAALFTPNYARADGSLANVKHIIVITQGGHSFDNYLGALPYASGAPYHSGPCSGNDHHCVDGLTCSKNNHGLVCGNANVDEDGTIVSSFHQTVLCTTDLDTSWTGSHLEGNFTFPNMMASSSPNDGFVRQNQDRAGGDGPMDQSVNPTMGFYTAADLPFYYGLAETFGLDDRYFSSLPGPPFPNRAYELAATSFGHLSESEFLPPAGGYKPIGGTIFDLLNRDGITWTNYFGNFATSLIFQGVTTSRVAPVAAFLADAAAGRLPAVSFVDPVFTFTAPGTDEHAPSDVRAGEFYVANLVSAVRNGPNWKDSVIFITYDQNGGFYDHVSPPIASQNGLNSPDGIDPGLCEDLSAPPTSTLPGGGANCVGLPLSDQSFEEATALCPMLTQPSEAYPSFCAGFNQLGFRVPLIAVAPFSKPHYVSHTVADHTSLLAMIEQRFLVRGGQRSHLTARDENASALTDMFDFDHSPSLSANIPSAPPSSSSDPGCS
jgi:phospholipase C